jgi:hypothetical protein
LPFLLIFRFIVQLIFPFFLYIVHVGRLALLRLGLLLDRFCKD